MAVVSRSSVAVLLVVFCISSVADDRECRWMMDTRDDQFERLMLAGGYANVHMYDESFAVLEALEGEDLTRDVQAHIHGDLARNYYDTKALEKARFHWLQAIASGRLPVCSVPWRWEWLAAVAFEMGRFEEAVEYAQRWHLTNDAIHEDFDHMRALPGSDLLLIAKYWSHVDRAWALEYVTLASKDESHDFDATTRVWIAQMREGEAPADIPPPKRPWLANQPPSLSAAEVLRRVEIRRTYRRRITRPAPQPGLPPRTEWVEDWKKVTLVPVQPQLPVPNVNGTPEAPVLPTFEYVEASDAPDAVDANAN